MSAIRLTALNLVGIYLRVANEGILHGAAQSRVSHCTPINSDVGRTIEALLIMLEPQGIIGMRLLIR